MKREVGMLLLVLLLCASLAPTLGLGCRYDPSGGPISVDGLPLLTTWEQDVTWIGPPTPHSPGQRLEQNGRVLVQRGDTANHVLAALGRPAQRTETRWQFATPPCTIVLEDAHVQEIRMGENTRS